jgi:hypothetical protein
VKTWFQSLLFQTQLVPLRHGKGKRLAAGGAGGGGFGGGGRRGPDVAALIAQRKQRGRSAWLDTQSSDDDDDANDEDGGGGGDGDAGPAGAAAVGRYLQILWAEDDAWYDAVVEGYDSDTGAHTVRYLLDDVTEAVDLGKEKKRWLEGRPEMVSAPLTRREAGGSGGAVGGGGGGGGDGFGYDYGYAERREAHAHASNSSRGGGGGGEGERRRQPTATKPTKPPAKQKSAAVAAAAAAAASAPGHHGSRSAASGGGKAAREPGAWAYADFDESPPDVGEEEEGEGQGGGSGGMPRSDAALEEDEFAPPFEFLPDTPENSDDEAELRRRQQRQREQREQREQRQPRRRHQKLNQPRINQLLPVSAAAPDAPAGDSSAAAAAGAIDLTTTFTTTTTTTTTASDLSMEMAHAGPPAAPWKFPASLDLMRPAAEARARGMRAVYQDDPEEENGGGGEGGVPGGGGGGAVGWGGLAEEDAEAAAAAALASDAGEGLYEEGERALQVAVQLFRADCSSGRTDASRGDVNGGGGGGGNGGGNNNNKNNQRNRQSPMTDGDRAEWRRAAALLERHAPGAFWTALRKVIGDVRRMDAEFDEEAVEAAAAALAAATVTAAAAAAAAGGDAVAATAAAAAAAEQLDLPEPEAEEAAAARRGEFGWELLFVAAGMWRAEGYESQSQSPPASGDCLPVVSDPCTAGTAGNGSDGGWVHHAWEAVSEALDASPLPPAVGTTTALAPPPQQQPPQPQPLAAVTALHEHFARRHRRHQRHHLSRRRHGQRHVFDARAYAAAVAGRVAALTEAWPRWGCIQVESS